MVCGTTDAAIYLVDDEYAIRDSLTLLFESVGLLTKSFDSAEAFLDNYDPSRPGCLILDMNMPSMNGLELQQELNKRAIMVPIIFISGNADIPDSAKAFRAGALDFLKKPFDNRILLERIEEAVKKDIDQRNCLVEKRMTLECFNRLTLREKEVLQLIISSHSNKEAARILDISYRTIDAHRARVMEKMQASSIAALVAKITRHNLLSRLPSFEAVREE